MPFLKTDWRETLIDALEDTTTWQLEMHIRKPDGAGGYVTPAVLIASTAASTLLTGVEVDSGATNGIAVAIPKASLSGIAFGDYEGSVKRIDGGRDEDVCGVFIVPFRMPPTQIGVL